MKKLLARGYLAVLLVILYAPILIIAVFSFTEAKVLGNWTGFSPSPSACWPRSARPYSAASPR